MASDSETRARRWTIDLRGRIDIFAATEEAALSLARDSCDIAVNGEAGIGVLAPMAAEEFVSRDATLDGLAAALFEAQAEIRRLRGVADALPLEGHALVERCAKAYCEYEGYSWEQIAEEPPPTPRGQEDARNYRCDYRRVALAILRAAGGHAAE